MQKKATGNQYRTTILCVDSYDGMIPDGRLYNPFLPGAEPFHGVLKMILLMENLLDQMHFPQSFETPRTFADAPSICPEPQSEVPAECRGACATFAVRVLFRQNASWQGSVQWLEGGREESFRSVLELLMLVHSALAADQK